jgi:hypothetical protein
MIFCICAFFLISVNAYSYQFEDYKWDTKKNEMKEMLAKKGRAVKEKDNTISYNDVILDVNFVITLFFTKDKGELCSVEVARKVQTIVSGDALNGIVAIGGKLKDILTEKYGKPNDNSDFSVENDLLWPDKKTKDTVRLEYSKGSWFGDGVLHATVTYVSGKYQDLIAKQNGSADAAKF